MALRAHLAALNALGPDAAVANFKLDEDTVTFKIKTAACRGEVSVSLLERSSYPRTGGFAFADGSDALVEALEAIAEPLGERAVLDHCVRLLCSALGDPAELVALLPSLPACGGANGGVGGASFSSALRTDDDAGASPSSLATSRAREHSCCCCVRTPPRSALAFAFPPSTAARAGSNAVCHRAVCCRR